MITPTPRNTEPGALARFQDAFAHALYATAPVEDMAALTIQPAFAIYRNTVMKGCIDAIQANYPAVTRLVGEEWLRAAAAVFVGESRPHTPTLLHYGADFADFLARFEPAAELAYLPGVARLDRYWTESHIAPDQDPLDPAAVADLAPDVLGSAVFQLHPAARWAWFDEGPIYTIWASNRTGVSPDADLDWKPEGSLLTRPHGSVEWVELDAGGCVFLDACAAGGTLGDAMQSALKRQSDIDFSRLMSTLLQAGALSRISFNKEQVKS